jgi:hypothetical protein
MDIPIIAEMLNGFCPIALDNNIIMTIKNIKKQILLTMKNDNDSLCEMKVIITIDKDGNILSVPNKDRKIEDVHLSTMITQSKYKTFQTICDLMHYLIKIVPTITNYCSLTGKKLSFPSKIHTVLGNKDLDYKSEELIAGNYVLDKLENEPDLITFVMITSRLALSSSRRNDIFEPFPKIFLKGEVRTERGNISKLQGENIDWLKDFDRLDKALEKIDENMLFEKVKYFKPTEI